MGKCKCKWRKPGIVLDEECEKIVSRWFCDIDYYDDEIGCNKSCNGYSVAKASGESEADNG